MARGAGAGAAPADGIPRVDCGHRRERRAGGGGTDARPRNTLGTVSPHGDDAGEADGERSSGILFFRLTSLELGLLLFVVVLGTALLGAFLGHRSKHLSDSLKEPLGILQGALLGLVGLLLAFGLSLAVSRYESRRANVVSEANSIVTTYLRAQTLPEPIRSRSLRLLTGYTRVAIRVSDVVPGSAASRAAVAAEEQIERRLWAQA